jgi:hypothetical protein
MAAPVADLAEAREKTQALPAAAAAILEAGRVPLYATITEDGGKERQNADQSSCAASFLGVNKSLAYAMAKRYRTRVAKAARRPHSTSVYRPRRNEDGDWVEIPNAKFGSKIVCSAELLVPMRCPWVEWPV